MMRKNYEFHGPWVRGSAVSAELLMDAVILGSNDCIGLGGVILSEFFFYLRFDQLVTVCYAKDF